MFRIAILALVSFIVATCSTNDRVSDLKFYGKDSRRAHMAFETFFWYKIPAADHSKSNNDLIKDAKHKKIIMRTLETQLAHMYGAFTQHEKPTDFITFPGIPREHPEIKPLWSKTRRVTKGSDQYLRIEYFYRDLVVFHKEYLKGARGAEKIMKFYLPKNPGPDGSEVYRQACPSKKTKKSADGTVRCVPTRKDKSYNTCTDLHYNGVGDFWYFWNPAQENPASNDPYEPHPKLSDCALKHKVDELKSDLVLVKSRLRAINNTGVKNITYPDYWRLYGEGIRKKKNIIVTYLVGIDENFKKKDLGRETFTKAYSILTRKAAKIIGDSKIEINAHEKKLLTDLSDSEDIVFTELTDVATIKKHFGSKSLQPKSGEIKRPRYLFFSHPKLNFDVYLKMQLFNPNNRRPEGPYGLYNLGRQGLTKSDIFIYDGHSGLGGYFALDNFFWNQNQLPQKKYQIFFFNGCSTFAYYNRNYFQNKKKKTGDLLGYENLDIVTNGIGAAFSIGATSDALFLKLLLNGSKDNKGFYKNHWAQIIDSLYQVDPEETALVQVNGDENNPKKRNKAGKCPVDHSFKPIKKDLKYRYKYKYHSDSGYCRSDI